ncbi:NB-ARC domain-containing protein [Microbispora bryophytorum]|uniref:NB-ARC domain-containing protein n=1 Tax=Microbispora bryophytorum TaxID=1460882 RepID=UPI0033D4AE9F
MIKVLSEVSDLGSPKRVTRRTCLGIHTTMKKSYILTYYQSFGGLNMIPYTRMTRSRLFVLIDAFENDMRRLLRHYVLDHLEEDEALGPSYSKANERREADTTDTTTSIAEYLDMREAYDLLNRHREALPGEVMREIRENTVRMDTLTPIRNRVMHGRPLQAGDAENALSAARCFTTRFWPSVHEIIAHLDNDPSWEPAFEDLGKRSDTILHNLPLPEYDETGLIGRSQDCDALVSRLLKRREPVITIIGEGGIGKTALALQAAYSLLDNPNSPYECILWVSLKTERLTASGVENIVDAIRNITGAARHAGQILINDFDGGLAELAEMLDDIGTLLIIDNLETVSAQEVIQLYETLPDNVQYLFTSRIGIGQLERKIPLRPLADKDADHLFRSFSRTLGLESMATLRPTTLREVVKRLRNSPLAIRWYLLSVEAGQQPNLALHEQMELIDFCVRSVYQSLKPIGQRLLVTLYALERDTTFDELALLIDHPIDSLRSAVQELLRGSLVKLETDPDSSLISRVTLTDAARQFLATVEPPKVADIEDVQRRIIEFRRSEEHRRADESKRQLAPNVVRIRSQHDQPTAHILRRALLASRQESLEVARASIARAREINPDFWEVDRVEAFLLSSHGHVDQASAIYRSALRKADEVGRAVVSYFFAGHLGRKAHDPQTALPYAQAAHAYFQSPDTAQLLGTTLMWLGEFPKAQEQLEWALDRLASRGRLYLITLTLLIGSWHRWSEHLLDAERRPVEAAQKAYAGFSLGIRELRSGTYDLKLAESTLESAKSLLRAVTFTGIFDITFSHQVTVTIQALEAESHVFERCRAWKHLPGIVGKLYRADKTPPTVKQSCESIVSMAKPVDPDEESEQRALHGRICSWLGTYGFIAHPDYPGNVFFPASSIKELNARGEEINLAGLAVKFEVAEHGRDQRPRASWVSLVLESSADATT